MFTRMMTLEELKEEPFVLDNIHWDAEPKDLMERDFTLSGNGRINKEALKGYVFYIDTIDKEPVLALMRHTEADYGETLAQINEIPVELVKEAIEENRSRAYFAMYPINKKIEDWLRKELGIPTS